MDGLQTGCPWLSTKNAHPVVGMDVGDGGLVAGCSGCPGGQDYVDQGFDVGEVAVQVFLFHPVVGARFFTGIYRMDRMGGGCLGHVDSARRAVAVEGLFLG